jgi:dethiobiotin synthetase
MHKIIVAGSGTDVGKTVVSAILTTLMEGDYWKPVQCGEERYSDTIAMKKLINTTNHHIYSPAYSLKTPLSPHHAARLENIAINVEAIIPPQTTRPLIIESVGGIFVPLSTKVLTIDLFESWNCKWVIVSKHYLGSINHTLLTIDALKRRTIPLVGMIFNGEPNPDSEAAILDISKLPLLGRLLPEKNLNPHTIQRYAKQWRERFYNLLP